MKKKKLSTNADGLPLEKDSKTKQNNAPLIFGIIGALIVAIPTCLVILFDSTFSLFIIVPVVFVLASITLSILARKKKWANVCLIILGFFSFGLFFIIGGIIGLRYFQPKKQKSQIDQNEDEGENIASVSAAESADEAEDIDRSSGITATKTKTRGEFALLQKLKHKIGNEQTITENENKLPAFITHTAVYGVILIAAVVMLIVGLATEYKNLAVFSTLAFALVPAYFLYLAAHNPFSWKIGLIKALKIVSIVLLVVATIVMLSVLFSSDLNLPLALFLFLYVAIDVAYVYGYLSFCKGMSGGSYIIIGTAGPFIAMLVLAAGVVMLIIAFLKMLLRFLGQIFGNTSFGRGFQRGIHGESNPEHCYSVIEGGYERTLIYYDNYNGRDRYRDDVGNYWTTDDGCTSFYRIS